MRKPAGGSRSELYPLLDFVIQVTVRGKYAAKIGELVHVIERVTVNCKGRIWAADDVFTDWARTSVFFVLTISPAR